MSSSSPTDPKPAAGALDADTEAQLQRLLGKEPLAPAQPGNQAAASDPEQQRCGMVAIVGKPNVGITCQASLSMGFFRQQY